MNIQAAEEHAHFKSESSHLKVLLKIITIQQAWCWDGWFHSCEILVLRATAIPCLLCKKTLPHNSLSMDLVTLGARSQGLCLWHQGGLTLTLTADNGAAETRAVWMMP